MPPSPRLGRPRGLVLNPDAYAVLAAGRPQSKVAEAANLSPSHLAELLSGRKGATHEIAKRLCAVFGTEDHPGALFPEMATFRIERREFIATGIDGPLVPAR